MRVVLLMLLPSAVFAGELKYWYPVPPANLTLEADVCVIGGSPAGVSAAVQTHRMGKKAVLMVFNKHVGGLTSGGLTAVDFGSNPAFGGMTAVYLKSLSKPRDFPPSEAEAKFRKLLDDAKVPVYYEHRLKSITIDGTRIVSAGFENGTVVKAKMFVDATYEGDLFAKAGVSFHVGREANSQYGETINGIQFKNKHQFNIPIDPYQKEGDPKSGLLWGVSDAAPGVQGMGDESIQAYNFRMFITKTGEKLPFPKPTDYDPARYALLARYLNKTKGEWKFGANNGPLQLREGDSNNDGGFSTDFIGGNHAWPEGDYKTREKIFQEHVAYQQGLVWFLLNDPQVPASVKKAIEPWGLAAKEFPETGGWPHQLYVREARRMVSDYVMTELDCTGKRTVEDSVGMGNYTMDSHNCRRVIVDGKVRNEGDVQIGVPHPYAIAYRSIVPKETECVNLFVPVCLSSTHVAYGSIRMEPVFMILGQSAATAACMAIDTNVNVQKVPYAKLKERLLEDKQWLVWTPPKKK